MIIKRIIRSKQLTEVAATRTMQLETSPSNASILSPFKV